MKKMPTWLVRAGQFLLVVAISYGIVRALVPELGKITWQDFAQWRPQPWLLIASLFLLLAFYLTQCFLWRHITTNLGTMKPSLRSAFRIYFISSLGRYIPGKLWQIAGMAMLAQQAGVSAVAA